MVHQALFAPAQRPHAAPHVEHKGDGCSQQEQSRDAGQDVEQFNPGPAIEGGADALQQNACQLSHDSGDDQGWEQNEDEEEKE